QHLVDLVDELAQMEGLGEDAGLAASETGLVEGDGGEAGDEHDAQLGEERADPARQLDAVDPRHHHIGEKEVEIAVAGERQGGVAVADGAHLVAGALERAGQEGAHVVIILGEEYSRHHASDRKVPARQSGPAAGLARSIHQGKLPPGKFALRTTVSRRRRMRIVTGIRVAPKLAIMENRPHHPDAPIDAEASSDPAPIESVPIDPVPIESGAPIDIVAPTAQHLPLILASPHSGTRYPPEFIAGSRLDAHALRRSEDSFVDEIFAAGPALGAPLLRARFARAYLDANREPYELDPAMFEDALPDFVNAASPRVQV